MNRISLDFIHIIYYTRYAGKLVILHSDELVGAFTALFWNTFLMCIHETLSRWCMQQGSSGADQRRIRAETARCPTPGFIHEWSCLGLRGCDARLDEFEYLKRVDCSVIKNL